MTEITAAFTRAMNSAGEAFARQMADIGKNTAANIRILDDAVRKLDSSFGKAQTAAHEYTTSTSREVVGLIGVLSDQGRAIENITAAVKNQALVESKLQIAATGLANTEGRVRVENIRNVGRLQFVEGQKNLIQVRENAKRRLLINQQLFQHLVRLEKTLGTGIAGAARGLSAGFSKVFTTVRGLFNKNNDEINTGFRKNGQAVERGLKRGNTVFNEGLNESLNKRERALQSSFTQQEHIVRRSVIRQEEQLTKLRNQTSHGVLGAVTGRGVGGGLGLGSLFGGIGLVGAAASTFRVGSEFVKGLSVLQTQLQLTDVQMKAVHELSIQLGNDITLPGVSALDAAQAIQVLTKTFGYLGPAAVDAAEKAAKGTLQLSRATGSSAEDSAAIIGAAVNVFKIGADQAVSIADSVAVAISKAAGVSFSDFKESFEQGATVFQQFVGNAEPAKEVVSEFSTALAILARNGITGSEAGAGLKQFFIQGTKEGKKALEVTQQIVKRAGTTGRIFTDASGKSRKFADSIDILRRGLVGLTDQERNSAIAALFGARSRVTANALINSSKEEFDALNGAMNRQGAAAAIAAAANTGLKGAFDALKSVIETVQILFYEKVQKPLGQAVLWFAALTNEILFSNGIWHLFRRAILGAAAAIGAVIALKGAIETIKLLSTALTALTSPFGVILIVAGLVGAAIALMTDNTSKLGKSLRDLASPLVEGFGKLIGAKGQSEEVTNSKGIEGAKTKAVTLADIFGRLKFILTQDVIPAVRDAAEWVGEHLVKAFKIVYHFVADTLIPIISHFVGIIVRDLIGAFHATVRFIDDVLIPGFKTVYHFVAETLIPKIVNIAGVIADAFVVAAHAVVDFWRMVKPYLDPLINGFSALGQGVGAIFTGDFSHLGSGFVAAGEGIAGTVAKTARSIGDALHPVVNRIGQFFTDLFSPSNIKKYIAGALNFINTLGYVLGRIVSDPRLIKTIAIVGAVLVAAAVKIAYQFITGFFRGVIENLPTLFAMASKVLEAGFRLAFANIGKILIGVVGILALGPTLMRLFRGAGAAAGDGFFAGLKSKANNAKSFLGGVLGGPTPIGPSLGGAKSNAAEVTQLQRQLRAFGAATDIFGPNSLNTTKGLKDARQEVQRLTQDLSPARKQGLLLRDSFRQAGVAAGGIGAGLRNAIGGVGKIFAAPINGVKAALDATNAYTGAGKGGAKAFAGAFKAALVAGSSQFKGGLKAAFASFQDFAKTQGVTTGKAFATGIASALVVGSAVVGGFVAGKAEGQAGGSGVLSALLGGLTTGALVGSAFEPGVGTAVGAAVGLATGGATLIGAAMGRAEKQAKDFRSEVGRLSDAFRGDFFDAIKAGQLALGNLDFKDVFSSGQNLAKLSEDFASALSSLTPDQAKVASQLHFNVGLNIVPLVTSSGGDTVKFKTELDKFLLDSVRSVPEFKKLFGPITNATDALRVLQAGLIGGNDAQKRFASGFFAVQKQLETTGAAAVEAGASLDALAPTLASLDRSDLSEHRGLENVIGALRQVKIAVLELPKNPFETKGFKPPRETAAAISTNGVAVADSLARLAKLVNDGRSLDEAKQALADLKFPAIDQRIVDAWSADFDRFQKEVQATKDALDGVPGRIAAAFGASSAKISAAQLTIDASGTAQQVQDALSKPGALGSAKADVALKGLGQQFGAVVAQGIADGTIIDTSTAKSVMQPFIEQAIAALDPAQPGFEEAKRKLQETFGAALSGLQPTIDDAKTQIELQRVQGLMTEFWKKHPATSEARVKFFVTLGDTGAGVTSEGDFRKHGLVPSTVSSSILDTLLPPGLPGQISAKATESGIQVPRGLTTGMKDPEAVKAMKIQVTNLANQAIAQFTLTLGIHSPSRVFHGFGAFLAEGFANGIASGAEQVANGAARMAQNAVDAAHGVLNGQQLSFGGISPANFVGQQSAANNAVQTAASVTSTPATLHPDVAAGLASLKNRGPDVTNVSIVEARDARATGRAVITELRTERMLLGHR